LNGLVTPPILFNILVTSFFPILKSQLGEFFLLKKIGLAKAVNQNETTTKQNGKLVVRILNYYLSLCYQRIKVDIKKSSKKGQGNRKQ